MRTSNNRTARALGPAIVAAASVLATAVALNVIVGLAYITPHVGDIVAFRPTQTAPFEAARLIVHRPDQLGCVLDLNVLRRSGGSLVIETQTDTPGRTFRVHWAGPRTSDEPSNCGKEADLVVDRLDLDILSMSAGGYGVSPKPTPFIPAAIQAMK